MSALPTHVRRSEFLVAYWAGQHVEIYDYSTGASYRDTGPVLQLISSAGRWIRIDALIESVRWIDVDARPVIARLVELGILRSLDRPEIASDMAASRWRQWNPAAGFYHRVTRDLSYSRPGSTGVRLTAEIDPAPLREPTGGVRVALPLPVERGQFRDVLEGRRTWRQFNDSSLPLAELSLLLNLTFGVQQWAEPEDAPRVALKTSPSGGARHSLEAYVVARSIDDVQPGVYHYHPDRHELTRIADAVAESDLARMLPAQGWTSRAAAVVFITSVFGRVRWRYSHPHAYRIIHLEAGHFGQTFCLAATWRGLAPFCTAALGDSAIEELLGINGLDEAVLYAVGVGARPTALAWAPDPRGTGRPAPRLSPPLWNDRG